MPREKCIANNFKCNVLQEKKSDPSEMLQLDGYTVDYIEPAGGESFIAQWDTALANTEKLHYNTRFQYNNFNSIQGIALG